MPQSDMSLTNPCFPPQVAEANFPISEERTRISNAVRLERDAGRLRREAVNSHDQAVNWHDQALRSLLTLKTDDKARLGLESLLRELTSAYGLGWSDIARLAGVSVPAVRKWRHGGDISTLRYQNVARLVAFMCLLEEEGIRDPATWLSLPFDDLDDEIAFHSVTKREIYASGGFVDLLAFAKNYISHEELLSRTADRASRGSSSDRVVRAPDGNLSIISGRRP